MWHVVKQLLKCSFFPKILQIVFALLNGITGITDRHTNRQKEGWTDDKKWPKGIQIIREISLLELSNYKNTFLTFKADDGANHLKFDNCTVYLCKTQ